MDQPVTKGTVAVATGTAVAKYGTLMLVGKVAACVVVPLFIGGMGYYAYKKIKARKETKNEKDAE